MNPLDLNKASEIATSVTLDTTEKNVETVEISDAISENDKQQELTLETVEIPKTDLEIKENVELELVIEELTDEELEKTVTDEIIETKTTVTSFNHVSSSKVELAETLKLLINKEVDEVKDEVEHIKQLFYKKIKSEIEEQKNFLLKLVE